MSNPSFNFKLSVSQYTTYLSNFIRLDMSEYGDSTAVNKILGSAPGYVGYDDNKNHTFYSIYCLPMRQSPYMPHGGRKK